ncbi:MAG TPA: L,D-transpeptidase [Acidimicrobiales bacterium]|nr:L,D-transpeptidase [Acidimicrobiales bacterium]
MRATRWVAVVALVAVAGCGLSTDTDTRAAPPPSSVAAQAAPPPSSVAAEAAPQPTLPPAPPKSIVATAAAPAVNVFTIPSVAAESLGSLSNPNEMGVPLVFKVTAVERDWLQVMLPMRPNGITGWVRSADVTLGESEWRARVELGNHRLTVWRGNDVVTETPVAVGTPSAPTPTGDFYLTEVLDTGNPGGAYGPYAFGLSAYSDVYTEFAGGPGQIGLHGTNAPGALGTDASHGCIRVDNDTITQLASELPVGSPITVTA